MAYTVTKLITNAYYSSGIVGREFQTVSGSQLEAGLDMLNDILADKTVEQDLIPYYTTPYDWVSVQGQEKYFIPDLISASTMTFFIGDVRYSMQEFNRDQFFGSPRANNIESLPVSWCQEKTLGGTNIFLYFFPEQVYPMQLVGLFRLAQVTINQDLALTLDRFYIAYLKFALASRLCSEFDYQVPPGVKEQLLQYQLWISKNSAAPDCRIQILSTFDDNRGFNYAQANLGKGYTATGRI